MPEPPIGLIVYVSGIIGGTVVLLLLAIAAVLWIVVKVCAAIVL